MAVTSTSLWARKSRRTPRRRNVGASSTTPAVPLICPYLIGMDGAWRSARPSRDQRCGAVEPAAPLALDKQRRLCLARTHLSCATHAAALALSATEGAPRDPAAAEPDGPPRIGTTRWSIVRTAPVVLDAPGGGSGGGRRRQLGQWALVGLMALALAAVILARLPEPEPPAQRPAVLGATGGPSVAVAIASTDPTPRPSASRTASPVPVTPRQSKTPATTATIEPPVPARYVVRAGDTLYGIARAHETTVEALQAANDLGTSTVIKVGQELVLP